MVAARYSLATFALVVACDASAPRPDDPASAPDSDVVLVDVDAQPGSPAGHGFRAVNVPHAAVGSFGLGVEIGGGNLALAWDPVPGADTYDVWRSSDPYFEPGGEGAELLASDVTSGAFVHVGGDDEFNAYYRVSADTGAISSTVGKFVQPIFGGYTKLGHPLITTYDAIGLSQRLSPAVMRVFRWMEEQQRWDSYRLGGVDPFAIDAGDVTVTKAAWGTETSFHMVGVVPEPDEVQSALVVGQNLVTVPLHYGDTSAGALFDAMQVCDRIGMWNAAEQATRWYTGPDDEDFQIRAGTPLHLDVAHPTMWPPPQHVPPMDPLAEPIVLGGLLGGFTFTEGVVWDVAGQRLLFVDIPTDRVLGWREGEAITLVRGESGSFTNGMAFDAEGRRIEAEHANQRITRHDGDLIEVLAEEFDGLPFNSPNDVVVHPSGALFFTDPTFGAIPYLGGVDSQPMGYRGVFMLRNGEITLVDGGGTEPNGIGISPDGRMLYVSDYADGELRGISLSAELEPGEPMVLSHEVPHADGLCLDAAGNVYVTSNRALRVFAPDGTPWGVIDVPRPASNCTFGGEDGRTLFVSARQRIYSAQVSIPGIGFAGLDTAP
jgi:gluconolactonase